MKSSQSDVSANYEKKSKLIKVESIFTKDNFLSIIGSAIG